MVLISQRFPKVKDLRITWPSKKMSIQRSLKSWTVIMIPRTEEQADSQSSVVLTTALWHTWDVGERDTKLYPSSMDFRACSAFFR